MQPDTTLPKDPKVKIYTALLKQFSTNAPTSKILHNTLGGIPTYTRDGVGSYYIELTGAFPENKVFTIIGGDAKFASGNPTFHTAWDSEDRIYILCKDSVTGNDIDDALLDTSFEIRIYQ